MSASTRAGDFRARARTLLLDCSRTGLTSALLGPLPSIRTDRFVVQPSDADALVAAFYSLSMRRCSAAEACDNITARQRKRDICSRMIAVRVVEVNRNTVVRRR